MDASGRAIGARNSNTVIVAAAAAYCLANLGWWMQPEIVNDVMHRFAVGEAKAGLAASAEMGAIAIGSAIFSRLIGHLTFRTMALGGALVAILASAFSIYATSYDVFLMSRLLAGSAASAPLAVSSAALAGFADPDKAYSRINIANALLGVSVVYLVGFLRPSLDASFAAIPVMTVMLVILSPMIAMMPSQVGDKPGMGEPGHQQIAPRGITADALTLVAAVFILAVMSGSLWSFYFVLGGKAGLSPDQVNAAIVFAIGCSVVGGFAAVAVGSRFGNLIPLSAGVAAMCVAVLLISVTADPLAFRIGAALNLATLGFLTPYFLGAAAAQDPSGRDGALVNGSFLFTGAVGPYVGGVLTEHVDASSIGWLAIISNAVAWLLFVRVTWRRSRRDMEAEDTNAISPAKLI